MGEGTVAEAKHSLRRRRHICVFIATAMYRLEQFRLAILSCLISRVYCGYMGINTSLECTQSMLELDIKAMDWSTDWRPSASQRSSYHGSLNVAGYRIYYRDKGDLTQCASVQS